VNTNQAQAYLKFWGNWTRRNRTEYLGYPRRNIFDKIMKEGTGASASTAYEQTVPKDVEKMERIYLTLQQNSRDAIWVTYVDRKNVVEGCRILNMKRERFRQLLRGAEENVTGALTVWDMRHE